MSFGVFGGMVSYRKLLVLGFFYRFYYDVMKEFVEGERDEEVVEEIEREILIGKEDEVVVVVYE